MIILRKFLLNILSFNFCNNSKFASVLFKFNCVTFLCISIIFPVYVVSVTFQANAKVNFFYTRSRFYSTSWIIKIKITFDLWVSLLSLTEFKYKFKYCHFSSTGKFKIDIVNWVIQILTKSKFNKKTNLHLWRDFFSLNFKRKCKLNKWYLTLLPKYKHFSWCNGLKSCILFTPSTRN